MLYLQVENKAVKDEAQKLRLQLEEACQMADAKADEVSAREVQYAEQLKQLVAELNAVKSDWARMSELAEEIKAGEIDAAVKAAVKLAREDEIERQLAPRTQVRSSVMMHIA